MKKEFLDLGKQPLGNKFLSEEQFDTEFFYNLKVVFDEDTKLVSMKEFVKPEQIFDAEYPYWTSKSFSFRNAFAIGCLPKSKNSFFITFLSCRNSAFI